MKTFCSCKLPLLDYCDSAWGNLLQQDQDKLQRLQNRAAKIVLNDKSMQSCDALARLHLLTLEKKDELAIKSG